MTTIRCSSLPIVANCPQAAKAPALLVEGEDAAARIGTAVHEALAVFVRDGEVPDLEVLACKYRVEEDDLGYLVWSGRQMWGDLLRPLFLEPRTEVELSLDDPSGVRLTGHIDLLAVVEVDVPEVRVCDFKTGMDADHDDQLRGYCLLALESNPRASRAYACVANLRQQTIDGVYYTRDQLAAWWAGILWRLKTAPDTYRLGAHCRFCPRALECPARTVALTQTALAMTGWEGDSLSPEIADRGRLLADVLDRAKMLEDACSLARNLVRAEVGARGGVVDTGDGRVLHIVERKETHIDFEHGYPVLLDADIPSKALMGAVSIGKKAVEKAVRDGAGRGDKKSAVERLMTRLDAAGALRTEFQTRLEIKRNGGSNAITHTTPATAGAAAS